MPLPTPLYAPVIGEKYLTITGALSQTFADQTVYDGETYRNELDAAYMGAAWYIPDMNNTSNIPTNDPAVAGTLVTKDDRYNAIPPIYLQKKVTLVKFWDGAAGTGNQVGEIPWPFYQGWSGGIPQYTGESPVATS